MNEVLDFEWIAAQAGVPVSFFDRYSYFLCCCFDARFHDGEQRA